MLSSFRLQHPAHASIDFRRSNLLSYHLQLGIKPIRGQQGVKLYNATIKQSQPDHVDLFLWNARGLITTNGKNKSQSLADYCSKKQNIIAVTESHLTPNHFDEEILTHLKGYSLHRTDRDTNIGRKSRCGGVALLASEDLVSTKTDTFSNGC